MTAKGSKSKKQSVANSISPPKPLIFFLDRCLGKHIIADALREMGHEVHLHDDRYTDTTPDDEWLYDVGKRGWIILSKDKKFRYRINELNSIFAADARAFVLTSSKDLLGREMAEVFVKAIPTMKRVIGDNKPPFVAHIGRAGHATLIKTSKGLQRLDRSKK